MNIEPKPPEIIQNVKWFVLHWKKNIGIILIAIVVGITARYYDTIWKYLQMKLSEQPVKEWVDYRGCGSESPYGDPPLLINFKDGVEVYVNFVNVIKLNDVNMKEAEKLYAAPIDAFEAFNSSLKSAVYSTLEKRTFTYAKDHREELAAEIKKKMEKAEIATAFDLVRFEFLEFCIPIDKKEFYKTKPQSNERVEPDASNRRAAHP